MQYTTLGKRTGLRVSVLGFGAMRLPMKGPKVDYDLAVPLMHRAFELGVNYVDSAVGYCNRDSQTAVGKALKGWRDRIVVCTKNSAYNRDQHDAFWRNLHESLTKLDTDCIDLYCLHSLHGQRFDEHVVCKGGSYEWLLSAKEQGLIRHIGFSFHDKPAELVRIASTGLFDVVTCQYNLIDRANATAFADVKKQGLGIVVMGPVGGGRLGVPSEALQKLVPGAASVPEVALRFVMANPRVDVALSGMNQTRHVEENCRTADRKTALTAGERRKVEAVLNRYRKLADLYCTGCKYCMPCPHGVDIPGNFDALNQHRVYDLKDLARQRYQRHDAKATRCLACGACLSKCPQHIDIVDQLRQTARTLDEAYGKLVVRLLPGRAARFTLRGAAATAELSGRLECVNISDHTVRPRIELSPGPGVRLRTGQAVGELLPFEHGSLPVTLEAAVRPDRPLHLGITATGELVDGQAGANELPIQAPPAQTVQVLAARAGGAKALGRGPKAHALAADPTIRTPSTIARKHAMSVSAAYDTQALHLRALVRDDEACLTDSSASRWVEEGDRIELELELEGLARPQGDAPPKPRWWIFIGLPEAATGKCLVGLRRVRSADPKLMGITPRRLAGGVRLDIRLPWDYLSCPPGKRGAALGFNFTQVSHAASGKLNLRRQWARGAGWIVLA